MEPCGTLLCLGMEKVHCELPVPSGLTVCFSVVSAEVTMLGNGASIPLRATPWSREENPKSYHPTYFFYQFRGSITCPRPHPSPRWLLESTCHPCALLRGTSGGNEGSRGA